MRIEDGKPRHEIDIDKFNFTDNEILALYASEMLYRKLGDDLQPSLESAMKKIKNSGEDIDRVASLVMSKYGQGLINDNIKSLIFLPDKV